MARPKKVVKVETVVVGDTGFHDVPVTKPEHEWVEVGRESHMNDYANRVWAGQSVDLPKSERIHRVKEALRGQGYTDIDLQDLKVREG